LFCTINKEIIRCSKYLFFVIILDVGEKMKKNKISKNNIKKQTTYFYNIKSKLKTLYTKIKDNPKLFLCDSLKSIKKYIKGNKYFCLFVVINLINAILLRFFTIGGLDSLFSFSPMMCDLAFLTLIGALGYLMNEKKQVIYYVVLSFVLMLLCTINSAYYTFYTSFASISFLSTTKFIFAVGDAVIENVIKVKDIIYPVFFAILIGIYIRISKSKKYRVSDKKKAGNTLLAGLFFAFLFALTLNGTNIGSLIQQWNRESIVNKYGIYVYHVNDLIKSVQPKIISLFGYDEAQKTFNEYFEDKQLDNKKNEYTDKFKGKNIIGIHAESIQNFVIGLKINGKEVTPNLNKLIKESLYFNNFYSQVSVGTSSDTEFTLATSLMPSNTGTAFGNYFDKTYVAMPQLLKEMGYYTFSMHANNADYWNRRVMHQTLGYDYFYAKNEFEIDETIGLGLSDSSFFRQAVDKLKLIDEQYSKYYGTFIMLTNHTPFSDVEKYGEFDVSKTVDGVKYRYMEDTKLGNYLKSVHYADKCLGEFFKSLEKNGLLENSVIVLYGDHDARLPIEDYERFYNYDINTDDTLDKTDSNYIEFDNYQYELNRKVPLIIWSKDIKAKKISTVMGMYDVMPTLGNMFGFYNKYALGHDIFNRLDDNIVVFPTGNWVTNKVYYNSQKNEYLVLKGSVIDEEYINRNNEYADELLGVSNAVMVYDLIKNIQKAEVDESEVIGGK